MKFEPCSGLPFGVMGLVLLERDGLEGFLGLEGYLGLMGMRGLTGL